MDNNEVEEKVELSESRGDINPREILEDIYKELDDNAWLKGMIEVALETNREEELLVELSKIMGSDGTGGIDNGE